jgi:hypothetical protein
VGVVMRTGLISFLAAILLLASGNRAMSQWFYQGEDSAFGGIGSHLAFTWIGNYFFGFRCDKSGPLAIFGTPEKVNDSDLAFSTDMEKKLLVRVDKNSVHELEALLDTTDTELKSVAGVLRPLLEEIMKGKKRVSVALRIDEQVIHEKSFNTAGSTKAVSQFLENCPSVEPAN